jgi:hypothetical protein
MTYHFSKIVTSRAQPQYGNFITNERYMVIDEEDEIGQYFVTPKMDYFNFVKEELEMYSIAHVAIDGKKYIINQLNKKVVGYYTSNIKNKERINSYAEIILDKETYSCVQMAMIRDGTHKNLLISNDTEQVFISSTEKKNKIDTDIIEVLHGTIEMQTPNFLLLFTSLYFLEEILFMGNVI